MCVFMHDCMCLCVYHACVCIHAYVVCACVRACVQCILSIYSVYVPLLTIAPRMYPKQGDVESGTMGSADQNFNPFNLSLNVIAQAYCGY